MQTKTLIAALLATSALTLAVAGPAAAGVTERARDAITAADAKIHTAETLGAATDAPRDLAEARAALAHARNDFDTDHRKEAIDVAIHAQALADTAIGVAQQHKNQAVAAAREDQRATVDAARDEVASARNQAAEARAQAQDQVISAQQQAAQSQAQAADANARAAAAQQSAAASAADAEAARNAAAQAAAQPPAAPQVETTITTSKTPVHHAVAKTTVTKHTTTTRSVAPATGSTEEVTATTKVTPQ